MNVVWLLLPYMAMTMASEETSLLNENIWQRETTGSPGQTTEGSIDIEFRLDTTNQSLDFGVANSEISGVPTNDAINLGSKYFTKIGRQNVEIIQIVDRTIQTVHRTAFDGLSQLREVILRNASLLRIDPDTFANNENLYDLTLAVNDLNQMQNEAYIIKSASIEYLDISNCNFSQLLATTFNKLPKLIYVNLEANNLKTLPVNVFSNVRCIEEIILSGNAIEVLPSGIFDRTNLTSLLLAGNEISSSLDFGTPNIKFVDLSDNKIEYVDNGTFYSMSGLESLILSGNVIRKVHQNTFSPLINLSYIDLSFNELEQISSLTFMANVHLTAVLINDNRKLKNLPTDGFLIENGTFGVTLFDAMNCGLTELSAYMFRAMPLLSKLNLSMNRVLSLPTSIFSYCKNLVDINLSGNLLTHLAQIAKCNQSCR